MLFDYLCRLGMWLYAGGLAVIAGACVIAVLVVMPILILLGVDVSFGPHG